MILLYVIGFGLKVCHLCLIFCYWVLSLISLSWLTNNGRVMSTKAIALGDGGQFCNWISELGQKVQRHYSQFTVPRKVMIKWWRKALNAWVVFWLISSISNLLYMRSLAAEKRKETLGSMCDERARMLQDQFNVSMNHLQAMSIMVSIFHHGKIPSAIDQRTFALYTGRTGFERPLTSGVAYAVRVLHTEREQFENQQGWKIRKMDNDEPKPVHEDEYNPADLEPSPLQDEYAPVIFAQDTVKHVISVDMLSGKEDRENVIRARESGKGVLTAPFKLLKTNRLGVILTFAVYKRDLLPDATPLERIEATAGYLGGIFDIESLVEKLLQQLASKQTILVDVYDITNLSQPISMYGSSNSSNGLHHVSPLSFGDPFRKHEMRCRFKQKSPWAWAAIGTALGIFTITMLMAQIIHVAINQIAKADDDYHAQMELKSRAQAADVAKSKFLATVSHEIRTPMNGVLGMLHMLMDTELDETQQDYVRTARESGKALVSLINEVLDQAKIESGKLELEAVCFDLRVILDDVISLFSGKSQDKKVELAAFVSGKVPPTVVGDPGRFRQIVTNLVGNSIKFTDRGHIFVTIHLVEEVSELIEVETDLNDTLSGLPVVDRRKSWEGFRSFNRDSPTPSPSSSDQIGIIVSVEDTGQGIPLEAQSRVFNPFMQVGPSITRTHGGTGIGLSISKCLVQLMKGELGLASSPQIGSTFTFTAIFTNGCSVSNEAISQPSDFQGMRALLLDPKPIRAKVSKYHIERLGIQVEISSDVKQDFSRNGPVKMIFIEDELQNEDLGVSSVFLENLRRIHSRDSPKIFLLSNSLTSINSSFLASEVPTPFVVMKPLRASMLAASLQRAMGVGNRGVYRNGELRTLSLSNLLRGRKMLVVDDNRVNLRVATGALKKYGADVANVERGKDAIALLTPPHHFDACFMDIQMPEMDGFEATRRIREVEHTINNGIQIGELSVDAYENVSNWHVLILAMTADVIQTTHEECSKSGMDGYISKPFEADQLYREVSRFFEDARDEDA